MSQRRTAALVALVCCLVSAPWFYRDLIGTTNAQTVGQSFSQTGHTVKGKFLQYWDSHGGLAQQGYPISGEFQETSDLDHKTYTVQYFERAVFELHPEHAGTLYEVLLSQLGTFEYRQRYPQVESPIILPPPPPGQPTSTPEPWQQHPSTAPASGYPPRLFPETGKTLGGKFLQYWDSHGGLAQQGYPISNEFQERSRLDGKVYTVQYFERAVFELHPENAGTPYEVLLAQLGTFRYQGLYSTQNLKIPGPSIPGRVQSRPLGSPNFLIWSEEWLPDPSAYHPPNAGIFGLDLQTMQALTVTAAAGDQTDAALSGSLMVWESGDPTYQTQNLQIHGKELPNGAEFTIASGPLTERLPAVFGRAVAWIEGLDPQSQAERVMLKDLSSGSTTVVETLPSDRYIMRAPVINDRYLVWVETTWLSRDGLPFRVRVLDRHTGQVRTVFESGIGQTVPFAMTLLDSSLLAGRDLSAAIPSPDFTIRLEGSTIVLGSLVASGSTLLWSDHYGIWGERSTDDHAVRLVASSPTVDNPVPEDDPTVAGAWLVWYHNNGFGGGHYGDGELKSLPLAAAFAGAGNPPFPLTPTPVPTPLPVSANLNAISYFAIDEGWAVGDGGAMLFWDGGDRWQPQRPTTSRDLRAIDILPSDNGPAVGWAVGDGVIVRAGFGDTPISIEGQLNSVEIISPDDAWAAGKADSPGGGSPNAGGAPLIMHYDGTSWQRVSLPFTGYGLSAVDMVSPTEGWAVGDGPALHYSGGVWSEVPLPGQVHLNGVAMISRTEGWAVGDGGIIMHYSSGQWQVAASPSRARLRAVAMSSGSSGEGFAVGDSGTILHYIGGTWSVSPNPTTANLRGLQRRLDVAVGAVGEGGVVLSYHEPNGWVQEQARPYGP